MKLHLHNVSAGYHTPLITEGNATLEGGQLVALLGRNGSGKSTLLRHIAGLLPLLSGEVLIEGEAIHQMTERKRAKLISVVTTHRSRIFQLTGSEVVGLGRSPYTNRMGKLSPEDQAIVQESLRLVGITEPPRSMVQGSRLLWSEVRRR